MQCLLFRGAQRLHASSQGSSIAMELLSRRCKWHLLTQQIITNVQQPSSRDIENNRYRLYSGAHSLEERKRQIINFILLCLHCKNLSRLHERLKEAGSTKRQKKFLLVRQLILSCQDPNFRDLRKPSFQRMSQQEGISNQVCTVVGITHIRPCLNRITIL